MPLKFVCIYNKSNGNIACTFKGMNEQMEMQKRKKCWVNGGRRGGR